MSEQPFNAADEKQVRARQRTAKDLLEQQREDIRSLLAIPEFRRFIWRLIGERCKLFESPGSTNGSLQSANVGRADVARELWAEIESVDALMIPKMMTETFEAMK